jgi:hypothetical protein
MKNALFFLAALCTLAQPVFALVNVGQKPKNYCWKDIADKTICLEDAALQNKVRVLLYNGGFCGPCNQEFAELPAATAPYKGKPVVFISLSASGWNSSDKPTKQFLTEWQAEHKLDKMDAKFIVAASPFDAGRDFFSSPRIPNIVILNPEGEVSYKAIMPGMKTMAAEIDKVLPRIVPVPVK